MTIQDIESLKKQAVKAALEQNWAEARNLNSSLLEEEPNDVPTLNRLGFAHTCLGQISQAKEVYSKVLTIDKHNPIAQKNLQKLNSLKKETTIKQSTTPSKRLTSFIEEPGKTKNLSLIRPGNRKVLLSISTGIQVNNQQHETLKNSYLINPYIEAKSHQVVIVNSTKHAGLASRAAELFTAIGYDVVGVHDTLEHVAKSSILLEANASFDPDYLRIIQYFIQSETVEVGNAITEYRGDLVIFLGEDYYQLVKSL